MKKLISVCLALVMLLTAFPVNAFAAENTDSEYDQLMELACEVFPEYADRINNTPNRSTTARSVEPKTVVADETRFVGDSSYLNYKEYSDGTILLTQVRNNDGDDFKYDLTTNSYSTGAGATTANITVKAYYAGGNTSSYFKLSNMIYTTVSNGYDTINSTGTASTTSGCSVMSGYPITVLNESASGPAKIEYRLKYSLDVSMFFVSTLTIKVGNNGLTITHEG